MTRRHLHGTVLECVRGDIARQEDLDAVVNAANAQLLPGAGVAGAIHRGAGPQLAEACRPLAPIRPGEAVITDAFNLPNRFVIHCLGPVYGRDEPSDELLAACYRNALHVADRNGVRSIGFPAISTGVFGYPTELAARVAFSAIAAELPALESLVVVRFVLFSDDDLRIHTEALNQLTNSR